MIAYRAPCPNCGIECWWRSYPNALYDREVPVIDVDCQPCKHAERTLNAVRLQEAGASS